MKQEKTAVVAVQGLSVSRQMIAAVLAIVAAVALPQVFHFIGAISGSGTVPGSVFSPMHLPVILVGLLAGPLAGGLAGLFSYRRACRAWKDRSSLGGTCRDR